MFRVAAAPQRARSPSVGPAALCAALLLAAVGGCGTSHDGQIVIDFWVMGEEGERLRPLVEEYEQLHPQIDVRVQQIPWSAAHEKLLTAFAGGTLPDACQLGNTWLAEFVALGCLADLTPRAQASSIVRAPEFFSGVWQSNLVAGRLFGVPWYVDTRLMYYRKDMLAEAGWEQPPRTWDDWLAAMREIKRRQGPDKYAILLPINEFEQPVIFGLQTGAEMLADGGRRGDFSGAAFERAFRFYVGLFEEGLAPAYSNTQISNVYQEFARGTFAMYVSGPWNVAVFRQRMPAELAGQWTTAPLPGPTPPGPGASTAGGCSLVAFRDSQRLAESFAWIEFLSEARQQAEFYRLSGNLPTRIDAWQEPTLADDPELKAFGEQLQYVKPVPAVPEWEQIATGELAKTAETVILGKATVEQALEQLDRRVDDILEKRRWMLARQEAAP